MHDIPCESQLHEALQEILNACGAAHAFSDMWLCTSIALAYGSHVTRREALNREDPLLILMVLAVSSPWKAGHSTGTQVLLAARVQSLHVMPNPGGVAQVDL